jgi:osmotically-inducible protein OsmY
VQVFVIALSKNLIVATMRTDKELQADVMDEIRFDPFLSSIASSIGVTANNGVITLSGRVNSFLQKHAVEDAAKRVKGVSFVAVDLEVQIGESHKISDTDIAQHVREILKRLSIIDVETLDIRVDEGWVTLEGTVRWNYQRDAVEEYVRNLDGVRGISNYIELTDEPCDPKIISEKINASFHRHATLDASNVQVDIKDRKVILKGTVRSWVEKKDAEQTAWSSPGIVAVDNQIKVDSGVYVQ